MRSRITAKAPKAPPSHAFRGERTAACAEDMRDASDAENRALQKVVAAARAIVSSRRFHDLEALREAVAAVPTPCASEEASAESASYGGVVPGGVAGALDREGQRRDTAATGARSGEPAGTLPSSCEAPSAEVVDEMYDILEKHSKGPDGAFLAGDEVRVGIVTDLVSLWRRKAPPSHAFRGECTADSSGATGFSEAPPVQAGRCSQAYYHDGAMRVCVQPKGHDSHSEVPREEAEAYWYRQFRALAVTASDLREYVRDLNWGIDRRDKEIRALRAVESAALALRHVVGPDFDALRAALAEVPPWIAFNGEFNRFGGCSGLVFKDGECTAKATPVVGGK